MESQLSVVVGAHALMSYEASQRRYSIKRAVVHERFLESRITHDIMLLELSTSIKFNEMIRPICVDDIVFPAGKPCVVTGWGTTDPYFVNSTYVHATRCSLSVPRPRYRGTGYCFRAISFFLSFFVSNIARKRLDRFAWNFQGRCGVTMGRPDSILGQFG